MGIPVLRGRAVSERDTGAAPRVVLINDTMARQFWPGDDPVGRTMTYASRGQGDSRTIVGVVADVKHFGMDRDAPPEFYTPQTQPPSYHSMSIVLRTSGDPAAIVAAARAQVAAMDREIPAYAIRTLADLVEESTAQPRFRTMLLAAFAALALVLAVIGVYGVIAYAVSQRTQEIGVRMALGALRADVLRLVIADSLRPILIGVGAGLVAAFFLTRLIATLLFQVQPHDVATFVSVPLLLVSAALVATYIPARRAARVDPVRALRST
jgi:putative ABC transport system permease protein